MFKGFNERRPWAAVIINLVFGPFLGMLYLGFGSIALFYLLIGFCLSALISFFSPAVIPLGSAGVWLVTFPLNAIGAIHGARIAKAITARGHFPRYARWYSLVAINLSVPVAAILIRTFLYQPFDASSASMEPSINVGDYFFASKRAYNKASPQRGDIVVFHGRDGDYVKRIAGIPGDRVQMVQRRLILNGMPVSRKRIVDLVAEDEFGVVRPIR